MLKDIYTIFVFLALSLASGHLGGQATNTPCNYDTDASFPPPTMTYANINWEAGIEAKVELALRKLGIPQGVVDAALRGNYEAQLIINERIFEYNELVCRLHLKYAGLERQRLGEAELTGIWAKISKSDAIAAVVGKVQVAYADDLEVQLAILRQRPLKLPPGSGTPAVHPCDRVPEVTFHRNAIHLAYPCDSYELLILRIKPIGSRGQPLELPITEYFEGVWVPRSEKLRGPLEIQILAKTRSQYAPLDELGWVKEKPTR